VRLRTQRPGRSLPAMASTAPRAVELTQGELAAWRGFLRVHAALFKALDEELQAAHGLPLTSYDVLVVLQAAPGRKLRMSDLADRVLLSRSGMTRLVDRLARDGLIERHTCTDDGRGAYAVLTARGAALLAQARPTHLEGVRRRFLEHFAPDELQTLGQWWARCSPALIDLSRSD
jgi:DNA-binding MarR family transcriptional regulator